MDMNRATAGEAFDPADWSEETRAGWTPEARAAWDWALQDRRPLRPERAAEVAEWFDSQRQELQLEWTLVRQRLRDVLFNTRSDQHRGKSGVTIPSGSGWTVFGEPNPSLALRDGYVVAVRVTYADDGRARLGGVLVDWTGEGEPPPLTAPMMRSIPFTTLVQETHAVTGAHQKPEGSGIVGKPKDFNPPPRRPHGGSREFSERVAQVYRDGAAVGAGIKAVMALWGGISEPTAERWVKEARERGLLEHSRRSRPSTNDRNPSQDRGE